jgi:hypothetical protein
MAQWMDDLDIRLFRLTLLAGGNWFVMEMFFEASVEFVFFFCSNFI